MTASEQTAAAKRAADAAPFMALRAPFPREQVGQLPRAGITLDYVGHGAITHRLLEVDPFWNWTPCGFDENGQPFFVRDGGKPVGLWIWLTVLDVTRLGFGSCPSNQFEAEKVLIGDALRNAAMRFGVALDLWIKGQAEDDERHTAGRAAPEPVRTSRPVCPVCNEALTGKAVRDGDGNYLHEKCANEPADPPAEPLPLETT